MEYLGVISNFSINHYDEDGKKTVFEFFKFLSGKIGMRINKGSELAIFENMEELKDKAEILGLSSEYINTASQIFE